MLRLGVRVKQPSSVSGSSTKVKYLGEVIVGVIRVEYSGEVARFNIWVVIGLSNRVRCKHRLSKQR